RPAVCVVLRAERLVRGRQVAFRVARAAPEERTRPARAPRDKVALVTARARDLKREGVRRRRSLLLDVVAFGVAGAADEWPELADEQVRDDLPDGFRMQPSILHDDVPAVDDRGDRGGVRGRPADAVLFERLDQARLCEARRRLREMLLRIHRLDARLVALRES